MADEGKPLRRPVALTKLIDTLERLFPEESSSRMVVDRAGMQGGMIAYSPRSIENWNSIVNEAVRQNALKNLVDAAAELYPNVPELRQHLADYEKWSARHVSEPGMLVEIADEKPPGFFQRTRAAIAAWFGIAVGCFAFIGVVARESTHLFLGLPGGHFGDALTSPGSAAEAGLRFLGRTLVVAGTYFTYNPIGAIAAVAAAAALLYFGVRRPRIVERAYRPLAAVPVVILAALAKMLFYDFPTFWFRDVLTTLSVEVSTFDPPAMIFPRVEKIWRGVVCSRIANLQGDVVDQICGGERPRAHLQNLYGGYLLDVVFTIAICVLGIAVLRRLTLPSRDARWNLPRTWKWSLVTATSLALLTALLAVPWTYGRTVASMEFPYICTAEECSVRICAEEDECFAFIPADAEIVDAKTLTAPPVQYRTEDVLQTAFRVQLQAPEVDPHDRASRLGGD